MERLKKSAGGVLGGLSIASVIGIAYAGGLKSAEVDHLKESIAANQAMIMSTRENMDNKIDQLIKDVAEIKATLRSERGRHSSKRVEESE